MEPRARQDVAPIFSPNDPRCSVVADDDERCRRLSHPQDPDSHQFGDVPDAPVDGGQHWSYWINLVNQVKNLLIGHEFNTASAESDMIVRIASAVNLSLIPSYRAGYSLITDDPKTTWRTYLEDPNGN